MKKKSDKRSESKRPTKSKAYKDQHPAFVVLESAQQNYLDQLNRLTQGQISAISLTCSRIEKFNKQLKSIDYLEDLITDPKMIKKMDQSDKISLWKALNNSMQRYLLIQHAIFENTRLFEIQQAALKEAEYTAERIRAEEHRKFYTPEIRKWVKQKYYEEVVVPAKEKADREAEQFDVNHLFDSQETEDGG